MVDIAQHPYYAQLFAMPQFRTFILVTYSVGVGNGDDNYWVDGISRAQQDAETQQFDELATFLSSTYPNKTFVLQHW